MRRRWLYLASLSLLVLARGSGADITGPMTCPMTSTFAGPNSVALNGITAPLTATGGNGCGVNVSSGNLLTTDSGNLLTTDSGVLLTN